MNSIGSELRDAHSPCYYRVIYRYDKGKGHDYQTAQRILDEYPQISAVFFCNRKDNTPQTRYTVKNASYAIYIKSTGGKWGKSARLIVWDGLCHI